MCGFLISKPKILALIRYFHLGLTDGGNKGIKAPILTSHKVVLPTKKGLDDNQFLNSPNLRRPIRNYHEHASIKAGCGKMAEFFCVLTQSVPIADIGIV